MTTVLFARIGWMKFYSGSQEGNERPVGGGGGIGTPIGEWEVRGR
jgi:hypothetical protein